MFHGSLRYLFGTKYFVEGGKGPKRLIFRGMMNVRICHSKAQRPKPRGMVLIGVSHSLVVGEEKGCIVCSKSRLYRLPCGGCSVANYTVNSSKNIEFVLDQTFQSRMENLFCTLVYTCRLSDKEHPH